MDHHDAEADFDAAAPDRRPPGHPAAPGRAACGRAPSARRHRERPPAVRTEAPTVSHQAVYDVLGVLSDSGLVRRIQPAGLRRALRAARRRQPPPRRVPLVRHGRRRRLRGRRTPLPRRLRHPRLRRRRGRGHLLGPVPRLRHPDQPLISRRHRQLRGTPCPTRRPTTCPTTPLARTDTSDSNQANAEVGEMNEDAPAGSCPVLHQGQKHPTQGDANSEWWPERLNLKILAKNQPASNPLGADFDYAAAFEALDLGAVKADITAVLHESKDFWPATSADYGPFMIRMAWHSAGTYRVQDGRGGWSRPAAVRPAQLLARQRQPRQGSPPAWPVKKKYGNALSWADLMILTGNVALEDMGFETFGFAGGRVDAWAARRRRLLGSRDRVARRRPGRLAALQGRPRARQPAGRGPDGPHLRQPRGSRGQPGPAAWRRTTSATRSVGWR